MPGRSGVAESNLIPGRDVLSRQFCRHSGLEQIVALIITAHGNLSFMMWR